MRFTSVRVMFALLLLTAAGCDKSYAPITAPPVDPPVDPPVKSVQEGLWTASGAPGEIIRLDPTQLLTDGIRTPAVRVCGTGRLNSGEAEVAQKSLEARLTPKRIEKEI